MDATEAQEALRTIMAAKAVAQRHSQNNGIVPMVWGIVVLACLADFDLLCPAVAASITGGAALLTALWTGYYTRSLPVQWKPDKPLLFIWWGGYHALLVIGNGALNLHLMFTLIGLLDAAPLLVVGLCQRRRWGHF